MTTRAGLGSWASGLGDIAGSFLSSLLVDPEVMRHKAAAAQKKIQEMQNVFDAMETTVNRTNNYWIGEAGDAHREYFIQKKPEIEEMFKRLNEHVRDLNQMASVYANVEKEVTEISEDLPADVIV